MRMVARAISACTKTAGNLRLPAPCRPNLGQVQATLHSALDHQDIEYWQCVFFEPEPQKLEELL